LRGRRKGKGQAKRGPAEAIGKGRNSSMEGIHEEGRLPLAEGGGHGAGYIDRNGLFGSPEPSSEGREQKPAPYIRGGNWGAGKEALVDVEEKDLDVFSRKRGGGLRKAKCLSGVQKRQID